MEDGGNTYLIIPQITNLGTKWEIRAYGSAIGGPSYPNGISDEDAEFLGLSPDVQNELNATRMAAKENVRLPKALRGQKHNKQSVSDLQGSLGLNQEDL